MSQLPLAPKVVSVMLAAGGSRRFDGTKLAAKLGHKTHAQSIIQHTFSTLTEATTQLDIAPPVVVLGGHKNRLMPLLPKDTLVLENNDWSTGLASSVAMAAYYAHSQHADAMLLTLADQVAISYLHYLSLYRIYCQFGKTTAAYYQQSFGVPAIFLAKDFKALQQLKGDSGAKKILKQHSNNQQLVVFPLEQAAIDIDTKADLSLWLANKE
ncbi:nucleotidyltransferase family protein [Shewanella donghaensis]|uniref:nucleotidyltransferase family protein n=1 Tax=Shewanella donghaensis TaxID=238836 RepID=UPI001D039D28|nr:nucleotidyltransferase family protein [Shewanella donghaensis]